MDDLGTRCNSSVRDEARVVYDCGRVEESGDYRQVVRQEPDSNQEFPAGVLEHYAKEQAGPVQDDVEGETYRGVQIRRADLMASEVFLPTAGDTLQRSVVRHDPVKVSQEIAKILAE
jgi:hypothetical protein